MSSHMQTELRFTDKSNEMLGAMPAYVKSYIRATHNRTSPRTRYEYLKDVGKFLDYISADIGRVPELTDLSALRKPYFEEYLEYLEHYDDNGVERTNGRTSIKRKLSSLRRFFAYLFENGLIPSDEIRKVEMPKLHKKTIVKLDPDEAKAMLDGIERPRGLTDKQEDYHRLQSTRDMAIVSLLLSTGMRVSECAELDVKDVDMAKCCARIVRKGGDEAVVYFSDEAAGALDGWLVRRKVILNGTDEPALFLSSRKTRMSVRAIEYLVKKYAIRSVPLKRITPHKLRATYATELYDRTGDIYLVAESLGHKDVGTTKDHYASMSDDRKQRNRNTVVFREREEKEDVQEEETQSNGHG